MDNVDDQANSEEFTLNHVNVVVPETSKSTNLKTDHQHHQVSPVPISQRQISDITHVSTTRHQNQHHQKNSTSKDRIQVRKSRVRINSTSEQITDPLWLKAASAAYKQSLKASSSKESKKFNYQEFVASTSGNQDHHQQQQKIPVSILKQKDQPKEQQNQMRAQHQHQQPSTNSKLVPINKPIPICADGQVKVSGWKRNNLLAKTLSHFDEIRGNQKPIFVPTKIKVPPVAAAAQQQQQHQQQQQQQQHQQQISNKEQQKHIKNNVETPTSTIKRHNFNSTKASFADIVSAVLTSNKQQQQQQQQCQINRPSNNNNHHETNQCPNATTTTKEPSPAINKSDNNRRESSDRPVKVPLLRKNSSSATTGIANNESTSSSLSSNYSPNQFTSPSFTTTATSSSQSPISPSSRQYKFQQINNLFSQHHHHASLSSSIGGSTQNRRHSSNIDDGVIGDHPRSASGDLDHSKNVHRQNSSSSPMSLTSISNSNQDHDHHCNNNTHKPKVIRRSKEWRRITEKLALLTTRKSHKDTNGNNKEETTHNFTLKINDGEEGKNFLQTGREDSSLHQPNNINSCDNGQLYRRHSGNGSLHSADETPTTTKTSLFGHLKFLDHSNSITSTVSAQDDPLLITDNTTSSLGFVRRSSDSGSYHGVKDRNRNNVSNSDTIINNDNLSSVVVRSSADNGQGYTINRPPCIQKQPVIVGKKDLLQLLQYTHSSVSSCGSNSNDINQQQESSSLIGNVAVDLSSHESRHANNNLPDQCNTKPCDNGDDFMDKCPSNISPSPSPSPSISSVLPAVEKMTNEAIQIVDTTTNNNIIRLSRSLSADRRRSASSLSDANQQQTEASCDIAVLDRLENDNNSSSHNIVDSHNDPSSTPLITSTALNLKPETSQHSDITNQLLTPKKSRVSFFQQKLRKIGWSSKQSASIATSHTDDITKISKHNKLARSSITHNETNHSIGYEPNNESKLTGGDIDVYDPNLLGDAIEIFLRNSMFSDEKIEKVGDDFSSEDSVRCHELELNTKKD